MASDYPEYDAWAANQTPDNMGAVVSKLDPLLVSEVQRYQGPKEVLHTQARQLAVKAVRTYDPSRGASLRTWVTTQLQPLTRYSVHLKPVRIPEEASRQSAELHRLETEWHDANGRLPSDEELADSVHMPVARLQRIRRQVRPQLSESQITQRADSEDTDHMPATQSVNTLDAAKDGVYQDLEPRDQLIYDWKTGAHGKDQLENQDIATRLKLSAPAITQITQRIANRIKEVNHGI